MRSVGVLLLAGVMSACWLRPARHVDSDDRPGPETVSVRVDNQNFYDATIYVVAGGEKRKLGVVTGQQSEVFTFRWKQAQVHFLIQLLAAGTYATETIGADPGDQLELVIAPDLHRSRVSR